MEGGSLQEEQKRELGEARREQTGVESESEGESEGVEGAGGLWKRRLIQEDLGVKNCRKLTKK